MALLELRAISKDFPGLRALDGVSFDLEAGEVHALCGENGAGKSTLIKVLCGFHPHGSYGGEIVLDGAPLRLRTLRAAEAHGIALIAQELALVPELSVAENLVLGLGTDPRWARGARLDWSAARQRATELIEAFAIVAPGPDAPAGTLSGGNQQKLLLARALEGQPAVLVMENPTRGLDVRTTEEMHRRLRGAASAGVTVIVHSTDLDEVLALADRVLVVHRKGVREAPRGADRRVVGGMMLGVEPRQRSTVDGQR